MEADSLDNDMRGWIMAIISGIACVIGSCIICIDLLIRYIPSKKNFRIQDNNAFLAASLSLSFGVMIFSSLYSMLPSSKKYLIQGGYTAQAAAWTLLACFAAGFIGIQIVSRLMHQFIPSHVSHCDHSHNQDATHHDHDHNHSHNHQTLDGFDGHHDNHLPLSKSSSHVAVNQANSAMTESTPLLAPHVGENGKPLVESLAPPNKDSQPSNRRQSHNLTRRPSLMVVHDRVMSFVKDRKANCDESGPCFGYTDLCGRECLKTPMSTKTPYTARTPTGTLSTRSHSFTLPEEEEEEETPDNSEQLRRVTSETEMASCHDSDIEAQQHHHHVPENAFMDIGLQTSIAIGLHKLPEGFITFATNHANPELGVSVFLALLVHNITEGFAMALPLYLALGSRPRAIFWSSFLGGVSQPAGAAIAAAWFSIAGRDGHAPNIVAYGCMFGITGGIMASVALHLFAECLGLNHNRSLCISFAFVGMALMGMSNALTSQ